jgi:hypothetical protein
VSRLSPAIAPRLQSIVSMMSRSRKNSVCIRLAHFNSRRQPFQGCRKRQESDFKEQECAGVSGNAQELLWFLFCSHVRKRRDS